MISNKNICKCCGAKIVQYRHTLSPILIVGLRALEKAGGGPINIKDLNLERTAWDNFQKLKYFGLVKKADESMTKGGTWIITNLGKNFLNGNISVPKSIWTYRGNISKQSEISITIDQVKGKTRNRIDYAKDAILMNYSNTQKEKT